MTQALPIPLTAPLSTSQQTALINLIRRSARAEIMPHFGSLNTSEIHNKNGRYDLVTDADTAAEEMLSRGIQSLFPHALVIGEEAASKKPELVEQIDAAELAFILDPIDGTWNFANRLGVFGTIVAVTRFGRPVLGVLYDPVANDWVIADTETPARRVNPTGAERLLSVGPKRPLNELSGAVNVYNLPDDKQSQVFDALKSIGRLQSLRSSCHEYRLLAEGQIDFVLSGVPHPWDHAAGVLICQQAGGVSRMLDGRDYQAGIRDSLVLSAANETNWQALRDQFVFLID